MIPLKPLAVERRCIRAINMRSSDAAAPMFRPSLVTELLCRFCRPVLRLNRVFYIAADACTCAEGC